MLFTYGEIFSAPPTANTNIDNVVKYAKLNCGIIDLIVILVVAGSIPLIAGAATISNIYNIDITKTEVPAIVPIFFSDVTPLEAIHRNTKNTANVKPCATSVFIPFIRVPSCFTAQPRAIKTD